jgi:hypothetical protein
MNLRDCFRKKTETSNDYATEIMQSTMGEYSIPAVSNLLLWMFFRFEKKKIWKK